MLALMGFGGSTVLRDGLVEDLGRKKSIDVEDGDAELLGSALGSGLVLALVVVRFGGSKWLRSGLGSGRLPNCCP